MDNKELLRRLFLMRNKLKKAFYANGRTPTICTDEALLEMAKLAPRHKEDLLNVSGLGQTFVDKYGDYFMVVLNQFHSSNITTKELDEQTRETLKILENRLVNISKNNRLLYLGKIANKYTYDLYSGTTHDNDVIDVLFGKKRAIKLCDIGDGDSTEKFKRYKKVLPLIREIAKSARETGQYDLYVGYPYVMGKIKGEDFDVRAPLLLFPVIYKKDDNEITISLDKSKDILFNTNLILLQQKFLQKNMTLPDNVFEDVSRENLVDEIINFYRDNSITIKSEEDVFKLKRFSDIAAKDFPKYTEGEFYIKPNAILGKFSLYSSALQRDFKSMIEDVEINELLDKLISNMDEIDPYIDDVGLDMDKDSEAYINFSEKNIDYINELNASQEQAILNVDANNELVIQGPPGTGKSQTITSLIVDSVNKGHNVLMVSQKKAALDVIYSRLGNLSKYTLMLNDVKDKNNFYRQLYDMFVCEKEFADIDDLYNVSQDIDNGVELLYKLADVLYQPNDLGECMYKIYQENADNTFLNSTESDDIYFHNIDKELFKLKYNELRALKDKFGDSEDVSGYFKFIDIKKQFPYIEDVKDNLKTYDIRYMIDDFKVYEKDQSEHLKLGFFKRLFAAKKRKVATKKLFEKYFSDTSYLKEIFAHPEKLKNVGENYTLYQRYKPQYNSFSDIESKYIDTLYKLNSVDSTIVDSNKLYDFIIYYFIKQFEQDNRILLNVVNNFNDLVLQINNLIKDKRELSKDKFKNILISTFFSEIAKSKRYSEMCRQIESNRKWNISKFIKKFNLELFNGIKVWLMTPESVSEVLPLDKGLFDILIFDEASQIYVEKGVPSIARAKKVVIAGDHKQLRPSSLGFGRMEYEDDETEEEELDPNAALEEESLLDLARFKYPSVLLNYHYRARYEELINFSNYAFYNGRLNVSPNTEEPERPPIEVIKIDDGKWIKRSNKSEAKKVVELIKRHFETRKNNETIGVITFNTAQRDAILDEIDNECVKDKDFAVICKKEFDRKDNGEDVGLFVKNIENVQGDERDCIIFSIAYARNEVGKVVRNFGWLNQKGGENRLNVAISRAKKKIYVVTSILPAELVTDDLKNEGPKLFRKYLDYCFAISDKDNVSATRILYSLTDQGPEPKESHNVKLGDKIYKALVDRGLVVERHVGIGQHNIDIAIKDESGKKYLIGIELDGKLYSSNMPTRERDIYRRNFLTSRGWNIYRLWSKNWYHDSQGEIDKIMELYNKLSGR